ncbi:brain-specific angiogenesis inhibitor 1-associated protein 2-like protein 2 [Electrophorus electricus]|uniref:brain-specific angiogenesis inhibitor 1-associated protein 2-like protein 2 n=1 Tax=Electrophorus electricus TaxID=8005 RepID=UPI0015D0513C|nr:brain-specific angiogenesis inhibitor 1-associated protein 2-like protein 2 [Electrophorus electricus]
MSVLNSDQLHRSTLGIYVTLMEQFNPNLQSLVALGNNYIQAFQALAVTSEAYFTALAKMGEQALQTMSSHLLGNILIQISESQRRLTTELEGVFSWFYNEVLREMENNVRLDKDYISASRRRYEMEVRNQATALERQLRRGGSKDGSEYVQFLRESQREALKEQERRYRFLAEKHCGLTQSIVYLINKTGGGLQQRAEGWREQVNQTRVSRPHTPSRLEDNMVDFQGHSWAEQPLGRVPSRGPSPQPVRSRSSSFGESLGVGGARIMRALVPHSSSSNPTLLSFSRGETITVLVSAPQNGWLYGRSENSARQGWFPAEYVGPIEDTLRPPGPGSLRSSSSLSNILDQSTSSRSHAPPPPPPAPPSKSNSSWPVTPTPSEKTRKEGYGPQPELFPRGTNPFATVKLKPTTTNDRSAPCLF